MYPIQCQLCLLIQAFLEMQTHKEALAMVNYYKRKPANIFGQEITFYLSKELMVIEVGTVFFFTVFLKIY